jgi:hypothetical protein
LLEIESPHPLSVSISSSGLLLTRQSYVFTCTASIVEELLPSVDLELLAPNGTSLAKQQSLPGLSALQYTLASLGTSDGGQYTCTASLSIPGSRIDSQASATESITVVDAYPVEGVVVPSSSSSSLEFTWSPPLVGHNLTTGFTLRCSPLLEGIPEPRPLSTATGEELTLAITGLYPGVQYNCSVVTVTAAGESEPMSVVQTTEETAPMGTPLSFQVVVGATDVTFTWSLPEVTLRNGIITEYTVSCLSGGSLMTRVTLSSAGMHKIPGFAPDTAYECSVVATNSKGSGPPATLSLRTQAGDDSECVEGGRERGEKESLRTYCQEARLSSGSLIDHS